MSITLILVNVDTQQADYGWVTVTSQRYDIHPHNGTCIVYLTVTAHEHEDLSLQLPSMRTI